MIQLTLRQVYDALAADGFEHLRDQWINDFNGKVVGGCALGQAAANLNVLPHSTYGFDGSYITEDGIFGRPGSLFEALRAFPVVVDKWKVSSNGEDEYESVAEAIVGWNDAGVWESDPDNEEDYIQVGWALPDYEDVVEMAYDVLEPFFDEVIEVEQHDFLVSK